MQEMALSCHKFCLAYIKSIHRLLYSYLYYLSLHLIIHVFGIYIIDVNWIINNIGTAGPFYFTFHPLSLAKPNIGWI